MNTRREAVFLVARWLETREFPGRMLTDTPDRSFIMDLVYTTVRRYGTLVWVLSRFLQKVPKGEMYASLLVGAAQLLFMPEVKDYAAVHETVDAAKLVSRSAGGLVNAVLRNILRHKSELLDELERQSLAIRVSHPEALVKRWVQRYGGEDTKRLCEWDNKPADTYLAFPPDADEPFVKLAHGQRVETQPGFAEGAFIVQDPATALAVSMLDVQPGMRVLDACSAPGGKTVQIAWRMRGEGSLIALDRYEDRLQTVRENLERTRQTWVRVMQGDLTQLSPEAREEIGLQDRILIDAPCSNSGVLRRRVDARWRWTLSHMKQLVATQTRLLEAATQLLAPNGKIVYSTCSLEPEENRQLINAFCQAHPEFTNCACGHRTPLKDGTDGAFAAVLART